MKFYVPEIGDSIRLIAPWSFPLYDERRNIDVYNAVCEDEYPDPLIEERNKLLQKLHEIDDNKTWDELRDIPEYLTTRKRYFELVYIPKKKIVTFPKDTILKIDRIYIRKGISDYSSVTFYIIETPRKDLMPKKEGGSFKGKRRFWAKLNDVNTIEYEKEISTC